MPHRLRQSQLIEFNHVAAGHEGVMSDRTGVVIVKPCHQSEIDFYETTARHPRFRAYIPEYVGTLVIDQEAAAAATASSPAAGPHFQRPTHAHSHSQSALLEPVGSAPVAATVPETWTPSGGRRIHAERGVVLENIAYGFSRPNILDVKLGARLWADDAPLAKRQRLDKASAETTSGSLGFRIAGMKIWQGPTADAEFQNMKGYQKHDKTYGQGFDKDTVREGFEEYFFLEKPGTPVNRMRKIIRRFIEDLRGLIEVLQEEESRMYSASLLFVYEGDRAELAEKFQLERAMIEGDGYLDVEAHLQDEESNGESGVSPEMTRVVSLPDGAVASPDIVPSVAEPDEAVVSPDMIRVVPPPDGAEMTDSDSDSEPRLPRIQALKVIDFAHASWTPGEEPDENMLQGIRNVIQMLQQLLP